MVSDVQRLLAPKTMWSTDSLVSNGMMPLFLDLF